MSDVRKIRDFVTAPGDLEVERADQQAESATARAERLALDFADQATKAALDGRFEEALQAFAKATDGTTNLQVLFLAFDFYCRTGDFALAEEMVQRQLAICGRDTETLETVSALFCILLAWSSSPF